MYNEEKINEVTNGAIEINGSVSNKLTKKIVTENTDVNPYSMSIIEDVSVTVDMDTSIDNVISASIGALISAASNNRSVTNGKLSGSQAAANHVLASEELFDESDGNVSAFLMNDVAFEQLTRESPHELTSYEIGGINVDEGRALTLNKPIIVCNHEFLTINRDGDRLNRILALTEGAIKINTKGDKPKISIKGYAPEKMQACYTVDDIQRDKAWMAVFPGSQTAASVVECKG